MSSSAPESVREMSVRWAWSSVAQRVAPLICSSVIRPAASRAYSCTRPAAAAAASRGCRTFNSGGVGWKCTDCQGANDAGSRHCWRCAFPRPRRVKQPPHADAVTTDTTTTPASLRDDLAALRSGMPVTVVLEALTPLGARGRVGECVEVLIHEFDLMLVAPEAGPGDVVQGWVSRIQQADSGHQEVEVVLRPFGSKGLDNNRQMLLSVLSKLDRGEMLPLTDKSSPQLITSLTGMSKSSFKNALGQLYKERVVQIIKNDGVRLLKSTNGDGQPGT